MKNKILLCGLIIVIMALIVAFGYTNARYYSTASMTGDLDYVKTIGEISVYQPGWIGGYEGPDNGSGVFKVPEVPTNYANIHYKVTNKIDDEINEDEVSYYIRIVAEDGSDNIPIEYNVHEYDNESNIYGFEDGVGYGPFTLKKNEEETQYYSIKAQWVSLKKEHIEKIQNLKVQMITKKADGSLLVIDDAPLNMEFTNKIESTIKYYHYKEGNLVTSELLKSQGIVLSKGLEIDFSNPEELSSLGITIPEGHVFYFVMSSKDWTPVYDGKITIPEDITSGLTIEVYCIDPSKIMVQLEYYVEKETGNEKLEEYKQQIEFSKGDTINFKDAMSLADSGINLPTGYRYLSAESYNIYGDWNRHDEFTLSNDLTQLTVTINVFVEKVDNSKAKVQFNYYEKTETEEKKLEAHTQLIEFPIGTVINFKDEVSLSNLGINLPTGYEFYIARCDALDSIGEGKDSFTIPYSGTNETYNIDVVLEKISDIMITVPVKFINSNNTEISSITINMKNDGTYDFTTSVCRNLCTSLYSMTSFTIYIANQWESTYEVGNTNDNGTVTVDYNATYTSWADFKLTDEGSYILIKAWW